MFNFSTLKREYLEANDHRLNLLAETNDYTIFTHFIGKDIKPGEFIHSPIRVDATPSFNIYYPKNPKWDGQMMYKDYSKDSGNVFKFVQSWAMYNENVYLTENKEIVEYIREKLGMGSGEICTRKSAPVAKDTKSYLLSNYDKYQKQHIEYLDDICIDKELAYNTYYVLPCLYLMNEHQQVLQNFKNTITFSYSLPRRDGGQGFKLYQPYEENFIKFFIHTDADIPQGFWQCRGTDTLIINKALKDILVVQSNIDEWVDMVAPHGEGYAVGPYWISWFLTYKRIIIMYDPDLAGISGMNKLKRALKASPDYKGQEIVFKFICDQKRVLRKDKLEVPVKDCADYALLYGKEKIRKRLKEILS